MLSSVTTSFSILCSTRPNDPGFTLPEFLLYCRYLLFSRERLCFLHPLLKARINDQTIGIGPGLRGAFRHARRG